MLYRSFLNSRGAGEEIRTPDLRITNALLYQLSYIGPEKDMSTNVSTG